MIVFFINASIGAIYIDLYFCAFARELDKDFLVGNALQCNRPILIHIDRAIVFSVNNNYYFGIS